MSEQGTTPGLEYNGWANYPTWLAASWLSNEEATYHAAQRIVAEAGSTYQGADALKAWIEGGNPLAEQASFYAHILRWAIQAIDWVDVAGAFSPEKPGGEPV